MKASCCPQPAQSSRHPTTATSTTVATTTTTTTTTTSTITITATKLYLNTKNSYDNRTVNLKISDYYCKQGHCDAA